MHAIKFALLQPLPAARSPQLPSGNGLMVRGARCSATAPPADIPAKNILRSPGGARPAAPSAVPEVAHRAAQTPGRCDKGLEEQKRKMQEQEAAKAQADKLQKEKQRQDNCNRARQASNWRRAACSPM
jgi:hypothetical protein